MEILLRLVARDGDPLTEAGDVVVVCPRGWRWSDAERASAAHRIVLVEGLTPEDREALMAPELPYVVTPPGTPLHPPYLRVRGLGVDLTALGDRRVLDRQAFLACVHAKAPRDLRGMA